MRFTRILFILSVAVSGYVNNGTLLAAVTQDKPDMATLSAIRLRDNATKAEVREYVQRILMASRDQRSFLASDPQIGMLKEIGPGHVDVLIEVAQDGHGPSDYAVFALEGLVTDVHKERILSALPRQRKLSRVVVAKGWEHDARDILVKGMRNYTGYLPREWISAVASFQDQSTYDVLSAYFVSGWNRHVTYDIIKRLPGMDLTQALPEAWENSRTKGNKLETGYLTADAVARGYLPALDHVIDSLDTNDNVASTFFNARAVALRYLEVRGSNADIRVWYAKHRDTLNFDNRDKKFKPKKNSPF